MSNLFASSSDVAPRGFRAGYDSECEYGDLIGEGDLIESDGAGGWQHVECADRDQAWGPAILPATCPRCFCVHNGDC